MKRFSLLLSLVAIILATTLTGCRNQDQVALDRMISEFNSPQSVNDIVGDDDSILNVHAERKGNDIYIEMSFDDSVDFGYLNDYPNIKEMLSDQLATMFVDNLLESGDDEGIEVLRRLKSNVVINLYDGNGNTLECVVDNSKIQDGY